MYYIKPYLYVLISTCFLFFGCGKGSPQPKPDGGIVELKSIEVKDKAVSLRLGNKFTLSYTLVPADATNKEVVITSVDPIISINGLEVTAVAVGTTEIIIKSIKGDVATKVTIEVLPILQGSSIELDQNWDGENDIDIGVSTKLGL